MIVPKDFYLLRTPLLPLNLLHSFHELTLAQLAGRMRTFFADPLLQEAIYIASPELFRELQKWQQGNKSEEKEVQKLVLSLFRYLTRMATRCTPYGLFAGCATGTFGASTLIVLDHLQNHKKHCRLDMNYVAELAAAITGMSKIQDQLLYYPNSSLYEMAGNYRYAAYEMSDKVRTYHLTEVAGSPYLRTILGAAAPGATLYSLAASITTTDISMEEARAFVGELVQSQILVSELEPTVTGEEFFTCLVKKLRTLRGTRAITGKLARIQQLLRDPAGGTGKYFHAHALVKSLLPETTCKDLVQTDLFLSARHNTVSKQVMTGIREELVKLWPLAPRNANAGLQRFCREFTRRYEEQEVPLLTALDTESGIGYAIDPEAAGHCPLVDGIAINKEEAGSIIRTRMQQLQWTKLQHCLKTGAMEVELSNEDLETLRESAAPVIPGSMYLMGSLLAKGAADLDAGDYRFELNGCCGPSAATLLGRFCHGDAVLAAKVQECLREEESENSGAIYAEIVHLPEARTGNILLRPRLRPYEIVYLGRGSAPSGRCIPLADLMVSVRANEVILRSKKWNKRVIPRLSTSHNFSSRGLPAYRFLCDLQYQQLNHNLYWQWNLLQDEPFLPRVRYGKIILARCTWVLRRKDYPELNTPAKGRDEEPAGLVERIRREWRLPRYVVITESDNELLLDLDSGPCRIILVQTLQKSERVVIQEFLRTEDQCFVEGEGGRFTHEMIIPLKREVPVSQASLPDSNSQRSAPQDKPPLPQRTFLPGSHWLYVKIYCGTTSAERLLREVIGPLTRRLLQEGRIDKWYFLRYADPGFHIRVRFHHGAEKGFWKDVLDALHATLEEEANKALAARVQLDTYHREIERYGPLTMTCSEDLFYYDSEAVIHIIDLLQGEEGETFRWLLAARGVDTLLNDFGYHLPQKALLLQQLRQAFFAEFGGTKELTNQLNDKYREHMGMLRSFLDERNDEANGIEEAVAQLVHRSGNICETVRKIKTVKDAHPSEQGTDELLPSYIHLFLNRMFLSDPRRHELVLYHFLSKYYHSQLAIRKNQQPQKV